MARYNGTNGNDLFLLSLANLAGSSVTAGAGYDTLKLSNTGSASFSTSSFAALSGVDALDFSSHSSGTLNVRLSASLLTQSDNGQLTIVSGAGGIDLLKASGTGGTVYVAGTGTVHLDDSVGNTVSIKAGASVHVIGGNGADTITASSTGSALDGGGGNDVLIAGAGSDQITFGTGGRADLVQGFNSAQDTVSLQGTGLTYMSEVLAHLHNTAQGAVLDLGNGDTLTLQGVQVADLTAANFTGITAGAPTIELAPEFCTGR